MTSNARSRPARVVHYDRNTMRIDLIDMATGAPVVLHRTSYWGHGDPPAVGRLLDVVYQDNRVIGGRLPDDPAAVVYAAGQELRYPESAVVTGPVIFLAGPTLGTLEWQAHVTTLVREDPTLAHVSIVSQRQTPAELDAQMSWDSQWMYRAATCGVVLFWIAQRTQPRGFPAYAQPSIWELSEWTLRLRRHDAPLAVGIEDGFPGASYVHTRLKQNRPHLAVHLNLSDTLAAATHYVRSRWPKDQARAHDPR